MPLNYPLKLRYYFCDESSFVNDDFMGIAGLVVLEGSIPILEKELTSYGGNADREARSAGAISVNATKKFA